MCQLRGSSSLPTITALPACRANSNPAQVGILKTVTLQHSWRPFRIAARPLCCRRPPFRAKDLSMKPEHETRRKIIREWMSLPKDKRQTEEQAKPFAKKAMERMPSSGDPYRQIMRWLLPRIGRP